MRKNESTLTLLLALVLTPMASAESRSPAHETYASNLWEFLNRPGNSYTSWKRGDQDLNLESGPKTIGPAVVYLNTLASQDLQKPALGATVVAKHLDPDDETAVVGTTVWFRVKKNYSGADNGWYWVHYTPTGEILKASIDKATHDKPGFVTALEDGRLWVFKIASPELLEFKETGEPAKHVTRPGAGPGGLTIKSSDGDTITEYMTSRPGYVTRVEDERLWVFPEDSEELAAFDAGDINEKHVTRPGAGPSGVTLKASTSEDIDGYLAAKPNFVTRIVDGRVWVFKPNSEELSQFDSQGELAKHLTWPAAGPNGVTLKGPDDETLRAYVASRAGFVTILEDGRIWVFRVGSPALAEFEKNGEPAKCVTRPGAGPMQMTVKSVDAETLDAYLVR